MRNNFFVTLSLILFIGCKQDFMQEEVFKHIDTCIAEYQKYHPNSVDKEIKSKTCSAVKNRMCIINQYCKGDELCIKKAKNAHKPAFGATGDDVAYCEDLVKRKKQDNISREACRLELHNDERCSLYSSDFEFLKKYQPDSKDYRCLTPYKKTYKNFETISFKCRKYDRYLCRKDSVCKEDKHCLELLENIMGFGQNKQLQNECEEEKNRCDNASLWDKSRGKSCLITN